MNDSCIAYKPKAKSWHSLLRYPIFVTIFIFMLYSGNFKLQIDWILLAGLLTHSADIGLTHVLVMKKKELSEHEMNPMTHYLWSRHGVTWKMSALAGLPTLSLVFLILALPLGIWYIRLGLVGLLAIPLVTNPVTYLRFKGKAEGS